MERAWTHRRAGPDCLALCHCSFVVVVVRFSPQAWLLNGITLPVATLVAVGYWALVYRPPFNPISACTHGLNLLVILVDAMVCSHTYVLSQYCVALA